MQELLKNGTRSWHQESTTKRYRKVAVFGGVYSNHLALKQLLVECDKIGVEAIFCLGDIGGFGPFPDRCFPLLRDGKIRSIAGNYDLSLARGKEDCGCGYTDPRDNYFARISYDYTFQETSAENKAWLGTLPQFERIYLGPLRVYFCHGSPRQTNEFLWESTSPKHLLQNFTRDYDADVICCTHTGLKWHRPLPEGRHFVNVGVIGRPDNDGQTNVWFTLLDYSDHTFHCEFRPLAYHHERLAREMNGEGLPEEFVATIQGGWWTTCMEILPAKERLRGKL